MQGQNLPAYKQTFLRQMDELRRQQLQEQQQLNRNTATQSGFPKIEKNIGQVQNNILNTSQYSSYDWRANLNQTTTGTHHNQSPYNMNLLMNPEVAKKQHNIRSTQISEYSNAKHNNTVFVNPKNTSC